MEHAMQRSKNVALMFLLGATLTGGAVGFTIDRMVVRNRLCLPPGASERDSRAIFYDAINASPEQRVAWDALLNERRRATAALNATIRPRVDSIREAYWRNATALLDADQRARLAQWQQDQKDREQRMREQRERERESSTKDRK